MSILFRQSKRPLILGKTKEILTRGPIQTQHITVTDGKFRHKPLIWGLRSGPRIICAVATFKETQSLKQQFRL